MEDRKIIEGIVSEIWNGVMNDLIEIDELENYLSEIGTDLRYRDFPEDLIEKAIEEFREEYFEEEINE